MQSAITAVRASWLARPADSAWAGVGRQLPGQLPGQISGQMSPASPTCLPAAALPDADFVRLHDDWKRLCGDRVALPRAELDPLCLPRKLLPYLAILERQPTQGRRLFYRLVGTQIELAGGRTMTRRYLSMLPTRNTWLEQVIRDVELLERHSCPLYAEGAFLTFRNGLTGVRATCHLLLPLLNDAGELCCALMVQKLRRLDAAHSEPFLFADEFRPGRRALVGVPRDVEP